jgi:hypothetical protein|tara:strand:+ start:5700 stop:6755 length:1056 start_codon:yes stop_codon:yes gene_type:complete
MPFEKVKFELPDYDEDNEEPVVIELEDSTEVLIEELDVDEVPPEAPEEDEDEDEEEVEIEVVDDTPVADRGRIPSEAPEDVTDEELANYSAKVRNRIKHFNKGYHDERRAKDEAKRESQELQTLVQSLMEQNKGLKTTVDKSQTVLLKQARTSLGADLNKARVDYKQAYEDGNSDALLAAQEALEAAKEGTRRLDTLEQGTLQKREDEVQQQHSPREGANKPLRAKADPRATDWQAKNTWFGDEKHEPETAFALAIHKRLVSTEGVAADTDEYYSRLNESMQGKFPELFGAPKKVRETRSTSTTSNVVAPASRSIAPRKVKITKTALALSKRLGLTPAQYANQAAIDARNE